MSMPLGAITPILMISDAVFVTDCPIWRIISEVCYEKNIDIWWNIVFIYGFLQLYISGNSIFSHQWERSLCLGSARRYYALGNALSSFYCSTAHIVPECTEPAVSASKCNHSYIAARDAVCSEFSVLCRILHRTSLVVEEMTIHANWWRNPLCACLSSDEGT